MRLVPFVFGHGPWIARWRERFPCGDDCDDAVAIDVLDDSKGFFDLVNAAADGSQQRLHEPLVGQVLLLNVDHAARDRKSVV